MADVDTSAEAVERLALSLRIADQPLTADIIEALAAARDAAVRERDEAKVAAANNWQHHLDFKRAFNRAEAERDAATAALAKAEGERDHLAAEVAALRLTLGGRTFDASVPEPIGCPMPGACSTVAEIVRGREMQAAWLRVIQAENTCGVTGVACDAVRCGCAAEQEMLIREAAEARAALGDSA